MKTSKAERERLLEKWEDDAERLDQGIDLSEEEIRATRELDAWRKQQQEKGN